MERRRISGFYGGNINQAQHSWHSSPGNSDKQTGGKSEALNKSKSTLGWPQEKAAGAVAQGSRLPGKALAWWDSSGGLQDAGGRMEAVGCRRWDAGGGMLVVGYGWRQWGSRWQASQPWCQQHPVKLSRMAQPFVFTTLPWQGQSPFGWGFQGPCRHL